MTNPDTEAWIDSKPWVATLGGRRVVSMAEKITKEAVASPKQPLLHRLGHAAIEALNVSGDRMMLIKYMLPRLPGIINE